MPTESRVSFNDGVLFIEGNRVEGVEDFKGDIAGPIHEYVKRNTKWHTDDGLTFYFTCRFDKLDIWKITGLYDWVCKCCPNRRVAHLARYGKNRRVKLKNFLRGIRILGTVLVDD